MDEWGPIVSSAEKFIRDHAEAAGAAGVVFGLSGGIDSAVTAYLCRGALGSRRCLALLLPNSEFTPSSETSDGMLVAEKLEIPYIKIPIEGISRAATAHDRDANDAQSHNGGGWGGGAAGDDASHKRAVGNLNARLRMIMLYYEAQKRNYLVVGTDDRSEHMIGYFTKHGDGACDILPIAELYKTQVWGLARHLGVPQHIIDKEPSPHLWRDHSISAETGMDYDTIDAVLSEMPDGAGIEDAAAISEKRGIPVRDVRNVIGLHRSSEHKRHTPPVANLLGLRDRWGITPAKSTRPWGTFERFTLNTESTVKIITIDPGASLSLQRHSHRAEFRRVVSGDAVATIDGRTVALREGESLLVPVGATHRLAGGAGGAQVMEISIGDFSEGDIVRLEDAWGRR